MNLHKVPLNNWITHLIIGDMEKFFLIAKREAPAQRKPGARW